MNQPAQHLRLNSIKLAGFKSFVDPTTVYFPSNLVAVVGPNGCGKSNIIDAVRWVMGESSAKNLRGESMADVIFNGSNQRKPLGQASIDLIFDNPQGALGGEYANYPEIVIRREVTRDGQSDYYINNARCRRRDIIDIFLGTGLGPRSYSIISQGTISKIIEAKPEELRAYLEEAAGISKYKERRRETENRMSRTQENLNRLLDLRDELGRQLEHLEKQAESAQRYTELKAEERIYHAQLLALRWRLLEAQLAEGVQQSQTYEINLEAQISKLHKADAQIELLREHQHEAQEKFQDSQAAYYELGSKITQIEQTIKYQNEKALQYERDMTQIVLDKEANQILCAEDAARLDVVKQQRSDIEPLIAEISERWVFLSDRLHQTEEEYRAWQIQWENFNADISEKNRVAQVEQSRIQHLESTIASAKVRLDKLQGEYAHLDPAPIQEEISELNENIATERFSLEEKQKIVDQNQQQLQTNREKVRVLEVTLNEERLSLQQSRGRLSSLEALQQSAMGKQNTALMEWINQQDLANKPNLASLLEVEPGWEMAVETVLGSHIQAICIDSLDSLSSAFGSLGHQNISLLELGAQSMNNLMEDKRLLSTKIKTNASLETLLDGVYTAEDLPTALAMRKTLRATESLITRDGFWVGLNWLFANKDKDATKGVLHREQEIRDLRIMMTKLEASIGSHELDLEQLRELLQNLETDKETFQVDVSDINRQISELQSQLRIREMRYEQVTQRHQQLEIDMDECRTQLEESIAGLEETRLAWDTAMSAIVDYSRQRENLQNERDTLQKGLEDLKRQVNDVREVKHEKTLMIQTLDSELRHKQEQLERLNQQTNTLTQRHEQLRQLREDAREPISMYQEELDCFLENRYASEEALNEARTRLQAREQELREQEQVRQSSQRQVDEIKSQLEAIRVQVQIFLTKRTAVEEQLATDQHDINEIMAGLPDDADENQWEIQLQRIANRISRLGAINLAAIDEYKTQLERKTYLDEQNEDLSQALQTLEDAIRKIDKETRQRFRETFDLVNQHFQTLFPKIFGGGNASLDLTGDDLLDTGVTVMARPPGKKNSTIHLLSGGEKALTAIALVFAIFQLNPAPFCMLDEVDAPLDDANVVRFSHLVKEMSSEVQFIFISHNKVAIEMAEHLLGVTMKEPGVSRLVSVNIEEAISMAET